MRYEVGKTYAFVKVTFINRDTTRWVSSLYMPSVHVLESVDVRGLKVTKHERVPSAWGPDDKLDYDGFLLEEVVGKDVGQVWKNQWPTASYGQLDDSADKVVTRHVTTDDWDILGEAEKNARVTLATEHFTDAMNVLSHAYKLKHDTAKDYEMLREGMSLSDALDFDAYILQLETGIENVTGRKVGYREVSYKPKNAPGYEALKGVHQAYYLDEEPRDILPVPTNYEEFRGYWRCLKTDEELFAYVRSEIERLTALNMYRDEGIHVYCGVNLGHRSYQHSIILKEEDLRYHAIIMQTKDSKNPEFIGDVDDIRDVRLRHLNINDEGSQFVLTSSEPIAFKAGDCDGVFNNAIDKPFFRALYEGEKDIEAHPDTFYFSTYGLSVKDVHPDNDCRLIFTSHGMAKKFKEWGKQDEASCIRIATLDAEMDMLDRMIDDAEESSYEN